MTVILDYTTDVTISAEGFSLKELFTNALHHMGEVLQPGYCEKATHYDSNMCIQLHAEDPTTLLIDFLSEVLALTYSQKAIYCYVYFETLTDRELAATLYGKWFGKLENEIKSCTYHEARVRQEDDGRWQTPIIFEM